ncbi:MAG: OmpA family protein [Arenimonas sp.]|nr:OmpA family protein [Arenimonas sp.]
MNPRLLLALFAVALSAPAPAAEAFRVPLVEGLVEVTAVQRPRGDEEHVVTITELTPEHLVLGVEFRELVDGTVAVSAKTRRIRRTDLAASNRLNQVFQDGDAELFPASTMGMLSAKSLAELKATGKTAMVMGTIANYGEEAEAELAPLLNVTSGRKYFRGDLVRVGTASVPITVQVNGEARALTTVQARGDFTVGSQSVAMELWVLDDPAFPLVLKSKQGRSLGQTVRIDYPVEQPRASVLEEALTETCRAELNGVYFDFGQATLLPASQPALAAVAELMQDNPAWTLRIEGHTDSVGGAAYNLDLSKRRANAVRDALTGGFKLPPARLQASGLGASQPVASNNTLEGRAANRRVELARSCP